MLLTEIPQLRTEDSAAIAGYGLQQGWASRGRMALDPYEQLAASFEQAWHQALDPAWRTQLQLGRDLLDDTKGQLPSDFVAAYLETALSLADLVELAVCCAWQGSAHEWQSALNICKEMGIDLSFAVVVCHLKHACPRPAHSPCACLFCYLCPDCREQRLVEGRDLLTAQAQGGRCAVCASYSTYQEWQGQQRTGADGVRGEERARW